LKNYLARLSKETPKGLKLLRLSIKLTPVPPYVVAPVNDLKEMALIIANVNEKLENSTGDQQ